VVAGLVVGDEAAAALVLALDPRRRDDGVHRGLGFELGAVLAPLALVPRHVGRAAAAGQVASLTLSQIEAENGVERRLGGGGRERRRTLWTGGLRGQKQRGQWRTEMSILRVTSTLDPFTCATTAPPAASYTTTSCFTAEPLGSGSTLCFLALWSPCSMADDGEPLSLPSVGIPHRSGLEEQETSSS
jgi:hypothetical protein